MKILKKISALITTFVIIFACVACAEKSKFKYADQTDRPDIDAPITRDQVKYPEYPSVKPAAPAPGTVPSISGYSAYDSENAYELTEEEDGTAISYADISDYSYIYVPVENYSPEYGNIKITFENGKPAAERVGIQAIYYEAKELGYTPVTVFIGDLVDGEQYLVSELGEWAVTDDKYNAVSDQKVRDKTIIGFVIFIDSLPSYAPQTDTIGNCKIKKFEFLTDDDPKLQDRYVVPDASLTAATADEGITLTGGETLTATAESAGTVYLPVSRYSSDFGEFTLSASGSGTVEIGLCYKLTGEKNKRESEARTFTLAGTSADSVYDFNKQFVSDENDDIKTQYVKGGTVTDIYIKLPASANITVNGVKFRRTVPEGAYVTNMWNGSGGDVSRAVVGGSAKVEVDHFTGWISNTVAVRKGEGVRKIVYTIYAPDGLNHIGIVVSTTSELNTSGQPVGNYVVRGSSARVNENASAMSTAFTAAENLEGVTEKITYDKTTKIYTFTYDFTKMKPDRNNKTFADYKINALLFYFNDPYGQDEYDGIRRLYFLSIDLYTE